MEVITAQTKSLCYNNETCQFEMVLYVEHLLNLWVIIYLCSIMVK